MEFQFDSLLDVIGELFSDEISIGITNETEYIYFRPSKRIDLKIRPGDPILEGTIAYQALEKKQKVSEFVERELFGVPYHGMAVPYYEDKKIKGTVLAVYPVITKGKSVITIKTADGWKPIPFEDVIYMEVKNRKTHVYAKNVSGTHKNTLQEFEYSLPKELFVRCHRSFIVNVHQIKDIFPDSHSTFVLEMTNGIRISVSQNYSSYFRKLLSF
ncbi:LytTR family transcriptional regulator [Cerasibacillus terrae]|uniref:LytTR family transcriptional regulator n=1 Tax=Cerasibacillus terrae TaxID=2498845 RepID=A0A5C8NZF9_9BACI|nr:LytTR family DNA-binding domain-containing protein [Cerasibacillus terrae]TXL66511.1 LytTR family transcriptional regulator [Cerasibacillus terrae]